MNKSNEMQGAQSPNDPKLSDCGATARPVPGSAAEAQDVTARSSSLQRMVRRRLVALDEPPQSGNEKHQSGIGESLLDSMKDWHPSYSEWLRCVEQCPDCYRLWDGKNLFSGQLQCWLDQWISEGRPEKPWPTEAEVASARACTPQKQSHQEES